jgi:DNA-binding NtrC family response regulator
MITVPPLRQRIQEDPRELDILLSLTVERLVGKPSPELTGMVRAAIDDQLGADYPWPGNVREVEQCVRRVLLKGSYSGHTAFSPPGGGLGSRLIAGIEQGSIEAGSLVSGYCYLLYQRHQNFEEVARRTALDRRTVKKYISEWEEAAEPPPSS